jgi:hypothetical protein
MIILNIDFAENMAAEPISSSSGWSWHLFLLAEEEEHVLSEAESPLSYKLDVLVAKAA